MATLYAGTLRNRLSKVPTPLLSLPVSTSIRTKLMHGKSNPVSDQCKTWVRQDSNRTSTLARRRARLQSERGRVVLGVKRLATVVVGAMVVGAALDRAIRKAWVSRAESGDGREADGGVPSEDRICYFE